MQARSRSGRTAFGFAITILGFALTLSACGTPQVHGGVGVTAGSGSGVRVGGGIGVTVGAVPANRPRPRGYCTFRDRRTGQLYYAPC